MSWMPSQSRYETMPYRRCGRSGLKLPAVSLGLWHNFGAVDRLENARQMLRRAFDLGITHFDAANNYGPPPGSAEESLGRVLADDLAGYRDELVISTKAGWDMWPGPYGNWGSRKYLLASLDASLKRLGLDYVDIFYHHRPDPQTPLDETMAALDHAVRSGKALYVGLSSYDAEQTARAAGLLRELGTPCLIHQPSYNMVNRRIEQGLLKVVDEEGIGCIVFSALAKGMLTDRYLSGIPADSRGARPYGAVRAEQLEQVLPKTRQLAPIAQARGQTLAQMAIAWVLRWPQITSAVVGASRPGQIEDVVGALQNLQFSQEELARIDAIVGLPG